MIRAKLASALAALERRIHGVRLSLVRAKASRGGGMPVQPKTDAEWARIYNRPAPAVDKLTSPEARIIADLTSPGESLLEAGCGIAAVSAELATAGRKIELLDFSPELLARAEDLFRRSGLSEPNLVCADLTKVLPLPDAAVDVVWSSGVLEHWTDEEIVPIVSEMARVSRRLVVSLVPSARCVWYRLSKAQAEEFGRWPYGREIPRDSLKHVFERAGLQDVSESRVCVDMAPGLLYLTDFLVMDPTFRTLIEDWWQALPDDDAVKRDQGYLLLTVGRARGAQS